MTIPNQYLNEEISSLEFDYRVLEEAMDERQPLLERVKFLAIFSMNLNEFFMTQVKKLEKAKLNESRSGPVNTNMETASFSFKSSKRVEELSNLAHHYLKNKLLGELEEQGLSITPYSKLCQTQKDNLRHYFATHILPVLTPLIIEPGHPFPHISNDSLNLVVELCQPQSEQREVFARIKVPPFLPRLCEVAII